MIIDIFNTDKKYQIIYADPPWRYQDNGCNGACENHYKTMSLQEICELPIANIASKDCVLFIWTTYPMLKEAMKVIENWGFKYKTIGFQWIKLNPKNKKYFFGLGRWTRGNTEPCLLAVRGKPYKFVISKKISQLIISPIMRHSKKPPEARERIIKLLGDIPRIELFARETANGWDCWGNEVEGKKQVDIDDLMEV